MRTIVHVSDIHFGKFDDSFLEPMLEAFKKISADLVIISGDITQRARIGEYEAAKAFLKLLDKPYFVIPGNHDVRAYYTPWQRWFKPFDRYTKYVSTTLEPVLVNDEVAIASIDTVRPIRIKDGKVSLAQIKRVSEWFKEISKSHPDAVQIVVTHHPLNLPQDFPKRKLAGQAELAVKHLAEAGIDMYLSGHYHISGMSHNAERHKIDDYSAIFVQAGTVSLRRRHEGQSFNVIRILKPKIIIETYGWNAEKRIFEIWSTRQFSGGRRKWREQQAGA